MFQEYQFNFSLPGARANGLGGAFIGLADDSTSSFTNPAGLAYLRESAITLEYRNRHLESREGIISGSINFGYEQRERQFSELSFASVNYRLGGWYLGLYQYGFLNEKQERDFNSRSLLDGVESREFREVKLDLLGKTLGFGVARRLKNFKLGATLNYSSLSVDTFYLRAKVIRDVIFTESRYESSIDDEDENWGFNIGMLHELSPRFSWGVVWRNNPRFIVNEDVEEINPGEAVFVDTIEVPFVVPDVFGAGMRWKATETWSLLLDWQRIRYSQIIKDGFVVVENQQTEDKNNYAAKDINEFHIGSEYLIAGENSVYALRAGYYRNPIHSISYSGNDPIIRDRFEGSSFEDENHITFGFGWVFKNKLEIDFSANIWERGRDYTASVIWRKK